MSLYVVRNHAGDLFVGYNANLMPKFLPVGTGGNVWITPNLEEVEETIRDLGKAGIQVTLVELTEVGDNLILKNQFNNLKKPK
jgi:hypothetical protein